ncbi:tRNA-uridine aminocarboxypropyltransferase [Marinobacterium arenosum]|uniref:tRNA-uridine aminocarboxypropyltransferase n=1 Tax=Marinobacterium arenosum TaxID=2862496 RepID=UPI001C937830|nr:DTW domain-containing protein [Marinobacterium arenosum]MBY4675682.1 DTW domain-containing protein [Marinobacterium arenosum]
MTCLTSFPRRPFRARGSNVERCGHCLLTPRTCICEFRFLHHAQARFCLLMHRKEQYKPTNTGRLIGDVIANTEQLEWQRTAPGERLARLLDDPTLAPHIVFPPAEDYRHRMVSRPVDDGRIPLFILPDGTWRQARRIFRHSRYLDQLPVISPQQQLLSRYHLRKKIEPDQLCTAEVAAAMLDQIGDPRSARLLDAYFDIFNEHYRASRLTRPLNPEQPAKQLIRALQRGEWPAAG